MSPPAQSGDAVTLVQIRSGMSAREVADALHDAGVIRNPNYFLGVARVFGADTKIQAGTYAVQSNESSLDVLRRITQGHVLVHRLSIPEGYSVKDVAAMLAAHGLVDEERFLQLALGEYPAVMNGVALDRLEGYLFPDTYEFRPGLTEEAILTILLDRFREVVSPVFMSARFDLTLHAVITLASIVEKEARVPVERPLIAGVYLNRLRIGMPLQADPTVVYALPEAPQRVLYSHLEVDSPYNTYLHSGLPPGPIANPGLDAIRAVLHPARTDYLYFVAKSDGTHHFSVTYEEHREAVRMFRPQL